jgi:hypothetical protein
METIRGGQADRRMTVTKVTLADIEKALRAKEPVDPKTNLL